MGKVVKRERVSEATAIIADSRGIQRNFAQTPSNATTVACQATRQRHARKARVRESLGEWAARILEAKAQAGRVILAAVMATKPQTALKERVKEARILEASSGQQLKQSHGQVEAALRLEGQQTHWS